MVVLSLRHDLARFVWIVGMLATMWMTTGLSASTSQTVLVLNQPIEREFAGGQTHQYQLPLKANEFVRLVLVQQGIDVVVRLLDAAGKELAVVDSPNGNRGEEVLFWVGKQSARLQVEVKALDEKAAAGKYQLMWKEARQSTPEDDKRITAQQHVQAGNQWREQQKTDAYLQALMEYQAAVMLWREASEAQQVAHVGLLLGWTVAHLGEKEKAGKALEIAGQLYKELQDEVGTEIVQQSLNNLASVELSVAAKLFAEAESLQQQGTAVGYQQAVEKYVAAAMAYRSEGSKRREALSLNNAGHYSHNLGERRKALSIDTPS